MLIDNPDEMLGELETVQKQKLETTVEMPETWTQ